MAEWLVKGLTVTGLDNLRPESDSRHSDLHMCTHVVQEYIHINKYNF